MAAILVKEITCRLSGLVHARRDDQVTADRKTKPVKIDHVVKSIDRKRAGIIF